MRTVNWPVLALILANIIWGATSPILKFSLENIPPFSLAFLRFLLASLILFPFVHKNIDYPDLKNKWLWIYALAGITFNISLFFAALQRTSAINATVIASSAPIMVLIGSAFFLKEKFKPNVTVGVLIAMMGTLVIIFQPIMDNGFDGKVLGNILMLGATFGAVISTLAGRKFLTPTNSLGSTFWSCFIGTLTFTPMMIQEYIQNPLWISQLQIKGIIGIIYGGLFSSLIAYSVYNWALAKLPAFKTSVFVYIDPIISVLVAIPLLGEKITIPFVIGSILIFGGILIAEKRIHWHPIHKIINNPNLKSNVYQ